MDESKRTVRPEQKIRVGATVDRIGLSFLLPGGDSRVVQTLVPFLTKTANLFVNMTQKAYEKKHGADKKGLKRYLLTITLKDVKGDEADAV